MVLGSVIPIMWDLYSLHIIPVNLSIIYNKILFAQLNSDFYLTFCIGHFYMIFTVTEHEHKLGGLAYDYLTRFQLHRYFLSLHSHAKL